MIEITRLFGFDSGHRILRHESKCANLHGHRYSAEVTCTAPALDDLGRVVDFSKIKELVGGWIDENWDHTMLLHVDDPILKIHVDAPKWMNEQLFGPKRPYIMQSNPTAENMSAELFAVATTLLADIGITVTQIKLYETPNCFAVYRKYP